jgi:hypothetical protein
MRRRVSPDEPLGRARLRTGGQLRIVEASSWGALIETTERLLPGRYLDVHVVSVEGRVLVRCRVARACVIRLEPDAVHYQAAFAFERAIDVRTTGYVLPSAFVVSEVDRGRRYPDRRDSSDIEFTDQRSPEETPTLTTVASHLV